MTDEKDPDGDYEVGHGRPPKDTRWKKGQSGNPKGRPKADRTGPLDISDILNEPVEVMENGKVKQISKFEAMMKKTAQKAIAGDVRATIRFIRACEKFDLLLVPAPATDGGVVVAPAGRDFEEWFDDVTVEVPVELSEQSKRRK